ncbi:Pimeloyl-ACP methyl ester carboxylesterase [Salinimicrobium sediminis]|uniref:Pimeloyl-ACP methyl ester carboxylesterase n=1 Tax=Salinimicrobium sediminis TaxID=1343891 RepID=A0A285X4A8_9FLAO|nr:alpha/beta hydrolase [Salinimicrobium sediminis]SOC80108.1 Pimeloyl-ACP methyl ester carboxylesterase [Salinimicrobium sediminis]
MAKKERSVAEVIKEHEASGTYFDVDGIRTFALKYGRGETVLCIHGVPTSSFLYRKVLRSLEKKGYKGVSIDLPGLGLTDRPKDFDYSFSNLADFIYKAAKALKLKKFHLVVHDVGGPIGFALAARHANRIMSLTILNTWIDVVNFHKPVFMKPFEKRVLGEAELKMMTHLTWPVMFKSVGVINTSRISSSEINAYIDLLKKDDQGKAFLKIMRNFDKSPEFRELCLKAVQNVNYPVQAVWGSKDPALTLETYGEEIKKAAGLREIHLLRSKHLLQEEAWLSIADKIVELAQAVHLKTSKKEA